MNSAEIATTRATDYSGHKAVVGRHVKWPVPESSGLDPAAGSSFATTVVGGVRN